MSTIEYAHVYSVIDATPCHHCSCSSAMLSASVSVCIIVDTSNVHNICNDSLGLNKYYVHSREITDFLTHCQNIE